MGSPCALRNTKFNYLTLKLCIKVNSRNDNKIYFMSLIFQVSILNSGCYYNFPVMIRSSFFFPQFSFILWNFSCCPLSFQEAPLETVVDEEGGKTCEEAVPGC